MLLSLSPVAGSVFLYYCWIYWNYPLEPAVTPRDRTAFGFLKTVPYMVPGIWEGPGQDSKS